MAGEIVRKALTPERGEAWIPCVPTDVTLADPAYRKVILEEVGPELLRRPLKDSKVAVRTTLANEEAPEFADFQLGIGSVLWGLLAAPDFLFRKAARIPSTPSRCSCRSA